ncbi:hypothetical protein HA075_25545 [bacterium BFN5]|nr:hypothetical protein HA075_25545 [bacterium BFN5]
MAFLGWSLNGGAPGTPPTEYTAEPSAVWVDNFIKAYLGALNLKLVEEKEVLKSTNSLSDSKKELK